MGQAHKTYPLCACAMCDVEDIVTSFASDAAPHHSTTGTSISATIASSWASSWLIGRTKSRRQRVIQRPREQQRTNSTNRPDASACAQWCIFECTHPSLTHAVIPPSRPPCRLVRRSTEGKWQGDRPLGNEHNCSNNTDTELDAPAHTMHTPVPTSLRECLSVCAIALCHCTGDMHAGALCDDYVLLFGRLFSFHFFFLQWPSRSQYVQLHFFVPRYSSETWGTHTVTRGKWRGRMQCCCR